MDKPTPSPLLALLPLYGRVGWGITVLFALVGNFAGHREGAIVIAIILALMWTLMRMVNEATDAYRVLRAYRAAKSTNKPGPKA